MDLSKPENWNWLVEVIVWLQHTPPMVSFILIILLVFGGYALCYNLNRVFKYELTHDIDLPFGIKLKGTRRIQEQVPALSVICRLGARSADQVQAVFFIQNSGSASAAQIHCDLIANESLRIADISREEETRSRKFTNEAIPADGRAFHFEEDPARVLHSNSSVKFASAFIPKKTPPFDLIYRVQAIGIDQTGLLRVDPHMLAKST